MEARTEREIMEGWRDKGCTPVVSVYYITYNQEKFVRGAIESFLMQKTDFSYEIVIGEDYSTDNTRRICEEYADRYPNIINLLPSEKNLGIIANSVRTLKACRGEYVAFCEGDDYWTDENKLAIQLQAMKKHPRCNVCFHPAYDIDSMSDKKIGIPGMLYGNSKIISPDEMLERGTGFMPTCCVVVKKTALYNEKTADFLEEYCYAFFMKFLPAVEGGCLYIEEIMAVRRYMCEGSYTKKAASNIGFALEWILDVNRGFDLCNKMTEFRFSEKIKRIQSKRLFTFLIAKRLPADMQRSIYMEYGKKWLSFRHKMHLMPVFGRFWRRLLWEFEKRKTTLLRVAVFWEGIFIWFFGKTPKKKAVKNIIVTGGGFENKGAQAMLFTVMDEMRRLFPGAKIHLFSTNRYDMVEKGRYLLDIIPWSDKISSIVLHPMNRFFIEGEIDDSLKHVAENAIKKADVFIDISGYALSSQWPFRMVFSYIMNLVVAKKYSVPFYVFPQSIGPFDYTVRQKILLYPFLHFYLKYPERVFVREKEAYELARNFSKSNLQLSADMVLSKRSPYKKEHIFCHDVIHKQIINIGSSAAGFFPNLRVMERTDKQRVYGIFRDIIDNVLSAGYKVYLLRHSFEDLDICREIKSFFQNREGVVLLEDDFNVFELEELIKQFKFVVASRYHSVVHSYRNGVPAVVLGWAEKYRGLLEDFGQDRYFVDCREEMNEKRITDSIDMLIKNLDSERSIILKRLVEIQKQNDIFSVFRV